MPCAAAQLDKQESDVSCLAVPCETYLPNGPIAIRKVVHTVKDDRDNYWTDVHDKGYSIFFEY